MNKVCDEPKYFEAYSVNFNFQGVIQIQLLYSINVDFNATLNECVKSLPFTDRLKDQQRFAIVSLLQGKDVASVFCLQVSGKA